MFSTSGDVQYIGDTMSTSGGYHQYIGGISSVHRGRGVQHIGGYHDACGGYHEYIGGCSVHQGDTMSTSGRYHEYIGDVQYIGGIS